MDAWGKVIESIPTWFQIQFYKDWDGTLKICNSCGIEYPSHKVFYAFNHKKCKGCEQIQFVSHHGLTNIFQMYKPEGYRFCWKCERMLPSDEYYFNSAERSCRECLRGQFGETNYGVGLKLSKDGLKRCRFCMEIKSLEQFVKVNSSYRQTRYEEYCKDCESEYKKYKRLYDKHYYVKNKDVKKKYYAYWKDEMDGREKRKISEGVRRSKLAKSLNDLTYNDWLESLEYFHHACAYCGLPDKEHWETFGQSLHQDHVIPNCDYGPFSKFNIIPACQSCNSSKKSMSLEEFFEHSDSFTFDRYAHIFEWMLNSYLRRIYDEEAMR